MESTKICPYCGATINAIARKCRFCGEWQSDEDRIAHGQAVASGSRKPVQTSNKAEETTLSAPPTTPPTSGNGNVRSEKQSNSQKGAVITLVAFVVIIIGVVLIISHKSPSQPPISNEQPTENYMQVDTVVADGVEDDTYDLEQTDNKEQESNSSGLTLPDEDYNLPPDDDGIDAEGTEEADEFTIN